jgi:hypothetical protein
MAENEQERVGRLQKSLADFESQAGRPFEHEARLRELVAHQAELNAALDLDKGERQVAPPADGEAEAGGNQPAAAREDVPGVSRRRATAATTRRDGGDLTATSPKKRMMRMHRIYQNRPQGRSRACDLINLEVPRD